MLDENLPTFFLKPSLDKVKHHQTIYLSHRSAESYPAYALNHLDPSDANSRNCYAAAVFDAFNPEVLFGQVVVKPDWVQVAESAEDPRKRNDVVPLAEPQIPANFNIHLYNPKQLVTLCRKPSSWGGSTSYEFNMPQFSFRDPSVSQLDKDLASPVEAPTTPQLTFLWRRESKLSKSFICYLTTKSSLIPQLGQSKKSRKHDSSTGDKKKEPDIPIAFFATIAGELTMYESNLSRVEIEDPKGLELVILLSAVSLRDLYYAGVKNPFHIDSSQSDTKFLSLGGVSRSRSASQPQPMPSQIQSTRTNAAQLRKQEQEKQLEKIRCQSEVDAEMKRLRKIYGTQGGRASLPDQRNRTNNGAIPRTSAPGLTRTYGNNSSGNRANVPPQLSPGQTARPEQPLHSYGSQSRNRLQPSMARQQFVEKKQGPSVTIPQANPAVIVGTSGRSYSKIGTLKPKRSFFGFMENNNNHNNNNDNNKNKMDKLSSLVTIGNPLSLRGRKSVMF